MNDATNGEVKTIKLTREDIRYIMSEVTMTDRADPFRERYYLVSYVGNRVAQRMRGDPFLHEDEIEATAEAILELVALDYAFMLMTVETQTGLVRNSMDVLEQISAEKRAALIREE